MVTEPEPVDVVTAARNLGVTPAAVRKRIRRGSLRAWKVDGVWRVVLPAGREPSYPTVTQPGQDAGRDALVDELRAHVEDLRGQVASLQRTNEYLAASNAELVRRSELPPASPAPTPDTPTPEPPATSPKRRGWLSRLLGR